MQHAKQQDMASIGVALLTLAVVAGGCRMPFPKPAAKVEPAAVSTKVAETRQMAERQTRAQHVRQMTALIAADRPALPPDHRYILADALVRAAIARQLDPWLVAAVARVESAYRPDVVSYAGAVGLMQILPYVAEDVARRNKLPWDGIDSLYNPHHNARIGAAYLSELIERFGDVRLALAAYNIGPTLLQTRLDQGWVPRGPYVRKVLQTHKRFVAQTTQQRWRTRQFVLRPHLSPRG